MSLWENQQVIVLPWVTAAVAPESQLPLLVPPPPLPLTAVEGPYRLHRLYPLYRQGLRSQQT